MHAQQLQAPPSTLSGRHLSTPHFHTKPPLGLTYVGVSQLQGIWYMTLAYLARGFLDSIRIVQVCYPPQVVTPGVLYVLLGWLAGQHWRNLVAVLPQCIRTGN